MTGEVDYGDVFYGDDKGDIAFKSVLKLLHLIFVITMVLLLHNLLIGMTVSDVQVCTVSEHIHNIFFCYKNLFGEIIIELIYRNWKSKLE